jgi:multidrug efflux system membrane fusion protein
MVTPDDPRRNTIAVEPATEAEQLSLPGVLPDSERSRGRPRRRWTWIGIATVVILAAAVLVRHVEQTTAAQQQQTPAPRAASVVAVPAVTRDLSISLTGLGTVTPLNTVSVRTQVDGQILTVRYREGQIVAKGDLLVEIDPRPFQAQLEQFEGQLARDEALLENARIDRTRYQTLWAQNSVQKQQLATQVSLVRQLEGTVKNDRGQIDAVRVNLAYCQITSPIAGRVGLRLVDPGNVVHTTDTTGLVVITQLQPITVIFTLPEDNIAAVVDGLARGTRLVVDAYDRAQQRKLASGSLMTIDNQIDTTTGTVKLRAEFPNTDTRLFPNQFVNARLSLGVARGATAVPAAAIQRSPSGTFVYVVNQRHTVDARPVSVGITEGDQVQITKGVAPGDVVVVDGADRIRDGSPVDARLQRS